MNNEFLSLLQPLAPILSAILMALCADILLRLIPVARDYFLPLLSLPSRQARRLHDKLNRSDRPMSIRIQRGAIALIVTLLIALVVGAICYETIQKQRLFEPLWWLLMLRATASWSGGILCLGTLQKNDLAATQKILQRHNILQPNETLSDSSAATRHVLECVALSVSYGLWLPIFYGVIAALFHLPATPIAVVITYLLWFTHTIHVIDHKNPSFAKASIITENILGFIPARIAALYLILASFVTPKANPFKGLQILFSQGHLHTNYNLGWPVAAIAGSLHVALSGGGHGTWLGAKDASARTNPTMIKYGLWLHATALALTILTLTALLFLSLAF